MIITPPSVKIVATILRGGRMGPVIMLGWLLAVIVVVVGLVLRFDPEARRDRGADGDG